MRLFKSVMVITFVTGLALLYVHQQVELVKLSYGIESKERTLRQMLDRKESLGYNIDNLEAPSRLEGVLLSRRIDIAFPGRDHVVKMAGLDSNVMHRGASRTLGLERKVNVFGILDFFGLAREAQAKEK